MTAKPSPDLHIPPSTFTISPGFTHLNCPAYSFLITHPSHPTRSLLFDLGVRKDWQNLSPPIATRIKENNWTVTVQKGVHEILQENSIDPTTIEGIIWSHHHWDHTGDPSTFPPSTSLIVGPGFKSSFLPGYPSNPDSPILESDCSGRELREITFSQDENQNPKIGRFNAYDYYADGSFYLLDSPGHAVGHMCALARISTSPDPPSYIFMGGDACHHGGEFRPSPYHPLPDSILPNPLSPNSKNKPTIPCLGTLFHPLLRNNNPTIPFYTIARLENGKGVAHNADEAEKTIAKVMEIDSKDEVLVVMAHDDTIFAVQLTTAKYTTCMWKT